MSASQEESDEPAPVDSMSSQEKTEELKTAEQVKRDPTDKVEILLKPVGDAPIMKLKKFLVEPSRSIAKIIEFIRKYLKLGPSESLFLYVNQSFAPSPDQIIQNLYECFGSDGKLVLNYCKSQAWG
ncbi:unnamed protein product [Darwinula stevensoni]|uniref:Ubiquitin-like protein ATG12 n=1 Tax=Darwinula stevensoni TaxID=69355 RepID=A0A7R8X882_9CRUS|nr:unnamed protein product [Darwinula stevensoni]CAG0887813.1 unnamed protein product [Darwinula stevensoni]